MIAATSISPDPQRVTRARPLGHALGLAALLILLDAFLVNQGVIAFLVLNWVLLIGIPLTALKRFDGVRKTRLRNIAIYAVAALSVFALNWANNAMAKRRGDELVSMVDRYHLKYKKYPESLQALVPEFIDRVPAAKYTFTLKDFFYHADHDRAFLYYVALPPFGRPIYRFDLQRWGYLD